MITIRNDCKQNVAAEFGLVSTLQGVPGSPSSLEAAPEHAKACTPNEFKTKSHFIHVSPFGCGSAALWTLRPLREAGAISHDLGTPRPALKNK